MSLLISNLLGVLCFGIFCKGTIGKVQIRIKYCVIISFMFILKLVFSQYFSPIFNLTSSILLYASILSFYCCGFPKKIFLLCIYMCFSMLSEEVGLLIIETIYKGTIKADSLMFYSLIIMSKIVLLMLTVVTSMLFRTVKSENTNALDIILLLGSPISTILFIVITRYPIYYRSINVGLLFIIALFLFSNMIICIEFYRILKESKIRLEYELLKEKQKSNKEYYGLLLKKNQKERAVIHDMQKHDSYLMQLLKTGQTDEAITYLNQTVTVKDNEHIIITRNKTLDIILNMNSVIIKQNQIQLDVSAIQQLNLDRIQEVDQCTIFANVIENAIESCMRSQEKEIIISLRQDDRSRIIFTLMNSCDNVKLDDDIFSSIKESACHGFGLRNVENCVKKYSGIMKVSFHNKTFTTFIVLPI